MTQASRAGPQRSASSTPPRRPARRAARPADRRGTRHRQDDAAAASARVGARAASTSSRRAARRAPRWSCPTPAWSSCSATSASTVVDALPAPQARVLRTILRLEETRGAGRPAVPQPGDGGGRPGGRLGPAGAAGRRRRPVARPAHRPRPRLRGAPPGRNRTRVAVVRSLGAVPPPRSAEIDPPRTTTRSTGPPSWPGRCPRALRHDRAGPGRAERPVPDPAPGARLGAGVAARRPDRRARRRATRCTRWSSPAPSARSGSGDDLEGPLPDSVLELARSRIAKLPDRVARRCRAGLGPSRPRSTCSGASTPRPWISGRHSRRPARQGIVTVDGRAGPFHPPDPGRRRVRLDPRRPPAGAAPGRGDALRRPGGAGPASGHRRGGTGPAGGGGPRGGRRAGVAPRRARRRGRPAPPGLPADAAGRREALALRRIAYGRLLHSAGDAPGAVAELESLVAQPAGRDAPGRRALPPDVRHPAVRLARTRGGARGPGRGRGGRRPVVPGRGVRAAVADLGQRHRPQARRRPPGAGGARSRRRSPTRRWSSTCARRWSRQSSTPASASTSSASTAWTPARGRGSRRCAPPRAATTWSVACWPTPAASTRGSRSCAACTTRASVEGRSTLPAILGWMAEAQIMAGRFVAAGELTREAVERAEETGGKGGSRGRSASMPSRWRCWAGWTRPRRRPRQVLDPAGRPEVGLDGAPARLALGVVALSRGRRWTRRWHTCGSLDRLKREAGIREPRLCAHAATSSRRWSRRASWTRPPRSSPVSRTRPRPRGGDGPWPRRPVPGDGPGRARRPRRRPWHGRRTLAGSCSRACRCRSSAPGRSCSWASSAAGRREKRLAREALREALATFEDLQHPGVGRAGPRRARADPGPPVGTGLTPTEETGRAPGGRGPDQPRDRGAHVPQPEDRRGEPDPDLPQARGTPSGPGDPAGRDPGTRLGLVGETLIRAGPVDRTFGAVTRTSGTHWVAECFWPGAQRRGLRDLDRRIVRTASELAGTGGPASYLGCLRITDDDVVLFLFEGPIALGAAGGRGRRDPRRADSALRPPLRN